MVRVLVVDDHAILRDGIRSLLESQDDIEVVGEASDGFEAIDRTEKLQPDVVLMDISMPRMNGLEATRQIKERFPDIKVLILTQHDNREYILPALNAGASGYVLKRSGRREMLEALRQVHEYGSYITSHIAQEIIQVETDKSRNSEDSSQHLTERERQTLKLIAEGKSNKEIALLLGISPKTVSVHRTNIMTKLDLHNLVELIRFASESSIFDETEPEQEL